MPICTKQKRLVKRIFISKNEDEVQELAQRLSKNKHELIAHSFLRFKQVEFSIEQDFDILFFSSPRAVKFYLSRCEIPQNKLVACTGSGTKKVLEAMGITVSFSGKESGKISAVAKEFKAWCGEKTVLFPVSNISKKTISSLFPKEQKAEVVVYETHITGCKIDDCDTYVFSSPSNVRGFLLENTLPDDVKVISWGESTSEELRRVGISDFEEMVDASLDTIFLDEA